MKKIIYNQYGNTGVLQMIEAPIPAMSENGILVKVSAVSINPLDRKIFKGEEKMMSGSKFPKGIGIDFSGIIENTGSNINRFKKGDEVFGLYDAFKGEALAEYIVVREKDIAIKPKNISFEQAAASLVVGLSALQILDKLSSVKSGTRILINGATGGIGMFLIQLAKKKGAIVTAVTSSKGMVMAKKWGADEIIDYRTQNILSLRKTFDVLVDLSGKLSFKDSKSLLNPRATFITTIPGLKTIIGSFLNNLFSATKYKLLILKPADDSLNLLAGLIEDGLDIIVEKVYPITAAKSAYEEVALGGIVGKAVITV
jgi:NADPH:quinone reductase-like Zn-dependent oxidoreductase